MCIPKFLCKLFLIYLILMLQSFTQFNLFQPHIMDQNNFGNILNRKHWECTLLHFWPQHSWVYATDAPYASAIPQYLPHMLLRVPAISSQSACHRCPMPVTMSHSCPRCTNDTHMWPSCQPQIVPKPAIDSPFYTCLPVDPHCCHRMHSLYIDLEKP